MPKRDDDYMRRQRQQIMDAALKCFASKGFHATAVGDIAKRCRLSTGGLYVHFKSKLAIFDAMVRQGYDEFARGPEAECDSLADYLADATRRLADPTFRPVMKFSLRLYADLDSDRALRRRYEEHQARTLAHVRGIAARDPTTRDLPASVRDAIARRLVIAIAGAFLRVATLPAQDAATLRIDLSDLLVGIVDTARGAQSRARTQTRGIAADTSAGRA